MAQGQQEQTPALRIPAEAWSKAAVARNFRVHDGVPMIEKDGALAPVPVPNIENPTVLALVFHAWSEYCRNRVGGSLNGTSLVDTIAKVSVDGSGALSPKSNDAFDSVYSDKVAELVDAAKGWDADAVKAMSKEARAERTKLIDASAFSGSNAPKNREKYYDATVREALEAGQSVAPKRDTKRKTTSTKESIEL